MAIGVDMSVGVDVGPGPSTSVVVSMRVFGEYISTKLTCGETHSIRRS